MQHETNAAASRRGLLLIVIAATLWGTVGVGTAGVYALAATNALSIGFFRLGFAAPALLLVCWCVLGRNAWRIERRDMGRMCVLGAMLALYQVCLFSAIPLIGVAVAVLVTLCVAPVLVALLSALVLRERAERHVVVALVCALCGTVLLVLAKPMSAGSQGNVALGVGLALGSAFGYAVFALVGRTLADRYHPLQPMAVAFTSGAALLLPFALTTGLVVNYPASGWALLLYLGLVPTAFGYVLFFQGMRSTTATIASIVTLAEPFTSTVLAWLLFGERLGWLGLLGAFLLLGAIGALYRSNRAVAAVAESGV